MEALGRGLVAGLLGTAAMTISSTAEAKPRRRAGGTARPRGGQAHASLRIKAMGTATLHHAVYAGASGFAYDFL
jgi:hypothetical protein